MENGARTLQRQQKNLVPKKSVRDAESGWNDKEKI
jgi:hypothetical protein